MEVFNLEQHWQDFKNGNIAINCKTSELAKEFLKYYHNTKSNIPLNYYHDVKDIIIAFGSIEFYQSHQIVDFQGFKNLNDLAYELKELISQIEPICQANKTFDKCCNHCPLSKTAKILEYDENYEELTICDLLLFDIKDKL